jgi:hypothetical protein
MNFAIRAAISFIAGAVGGAVNGVALWLFGVLGITLALGFKMAPNFTIPWLLPRMLFGGLWGLLFLLPFRRDKPYLKGLVLSLAPSAYMLFKVFPEMGAGVPGLAKGPGSPFFVLFFNAIRGLSAAWVIARFPVAMKLSAEPSES